MRTTILAVIWLIAAVACGGAGSTAPGAKSSGDGSDPSNDGAQGEGASGPALPSCEDGSCTTCGDTVCLPGYFCETNGGVTGCGWNAKCAKDATCGCLEDLVADCECEDRDGWAFVTCPGSY